MLKASEPMSLEHDQPMAELRSELSRILECLDELCLHQAAAHLSMAIHCLEASSGLPSQVAARAGAPL